MSRNIKRKHSTRPGIASDSESAVLKGSIGQIQRQVADAHRRKFGVNPWGRWNGFPIGGRGKG